MDIVSYNQRSLNRCWEADKLMVSSIILNPNDVEEQRCYIMLSIEFFLTKSKIVNVVLLYPSLAYYLTYSRYKIVFNHIQLFVTPWTVAHQAPLSVGFSRQEYWSRLPFPPRGDLLPQPRDQTLISQVSRIAGGFCATKLLGIPQYMSEIYSNHSVVEMHWRKECLM